MSFNKITIVGYLGRDPELRYTPQGTAVCKMSVATTERRKNVAGESEEHTTWFRVTVWGRQAELANEYLAKGRQVYIEGRLRLSEYTDRDGNTRISPEVNASDLQFLGQRGDVMAEAPSAEAEPVEKVEEKREEVEAPRAKMTANKPAPKAAAAPKRPAGKPLVSIEEDEIPF
jgi:single-strand DNA-binding protein